MTPAADGMDANGARAHLALGRVHYVRTMAGVVATAERDRAALCSVAAGTFALLRNGFGDPVGYVLWANVSRETYVQLRDRGTMPRFAYEWSEGPVTLVLDVVLLPEWRGSMTGVLLAMRHDRRAIAARRGDAAPRLHVRA